MNGGIIHRGVLFAALFLALTVFHAGAALASVNTQYMDSAFGIYSAHSLTVHGWFRTQMGYSKAQYWAWVEDKLADLGAHWDRSHLELVWDIVEPTLGGGYSWNNSMDTDNVIETMYAERGGTHWLGGFHQGGPSLRNQLDYTNEYAQFVRAVVERYDGDGVSDASTDVCVKWWQAGNESIDWTVTLGQSADQYVEWVRLVRSAALQADPDAKIALIASMDSQNKEDFTVRVIKQLAAEKGFDAIDIHFWDEAETWKIGAAPEYRALLDSLGLSKVEIWSCETATWVGQPQGRQWQSEEQHAASLVKRYVWGRANDIDKLMWSELVDFHDYKGMSNSMWNSVGLISDGEDSGDDSSRFNTERVAYWAYKLLAEKTDTGRATLRRTVSGVHDESDNFAYEYQSAGSDNQFFILWSESGSGNVSVPVTGSLYCARGFVTDRFGKFLTAYDVPASNDRIQLSLSSNPLLVEAVGDSDGDGNSDILEIAQGGNPYDPSDGSTNVSPNAYPDFEVQDIALTPAIPAYGKTFTASVVVSNSGGGVGNAGYLYVYTNKPGEVASKTAPTKYKFVGTLSAGASKTYTFTGLRSGDEGERVFRAFIDARGATSESNETNNQKTIAYTVARKPDLMVRTIRFSPAKPPRGGTFSAWVAVKNMGSCPASNVYASVWVNEPSVPASNAGETTGAMIGTIASGETVSNRFDGLEAGTGTDTRIFRAFADSKLELDESVETDNQKKKSYTPKSCPDFAITGMSLSPADPVANSNFTAYVTVKNQGYVDGSVKYVDVWADRTNEVETARTNRGDKYVSIGVLKRDATVTKTFTGLNAGSGVTGRTFRAFADSRGLTQEVCETNNQGTVVYTPAP